MASLVVEDVGWRALVEDSGRPGFADLGLGPAGFADRGAARLANRMLGNPEGAALIEALLGGIALRAQGAALIAVTGAPCPLALRDRGGSVRHPAMYEVIALADGERLELGSPTRGLRSYIAVHGGIAVEPVLGSRAHDSLSGIGPAPLAPGCVLPVGPDAEGWPLVDAVPWPAWAADGADADDTDAAGAGPGSVPVPVLEAIRGPRDDWFEPESLSWLGTGVFEVTSEADRIGVRLTSERPLRRRSAAELPSEGAELGSIQVPPDGHPIVFLADHPVTGGYPIAAVLTAAAIDRAAQLVPGQRVRFRLRAARGLG